MWLLAPDEGGCLHAAGSMLNIGYFAHPFPLFWGLGHVTQADRRDEDQRDEESSHYAKTSDRPIQWAHKYIYIHRLYRFIIHAFINRSSVPPYYSV